MPNYDQYIPVAKQAGFSGQGLIQIMAIAFAESGLNPNARNVNTDGSIDRGILQINNRWHSEITDACAYNPVCAFQAGWTISQKGTNFGQWATYDNKVPAYSTGVTDVTALLNGKNMSNNGVPGTGDPCLACGPLGSAAYLQCHAALAAKVGSVPDCAKPGIQKNKQDIQNAASDPVGTAVKLMFQPLFDALPMFGIHLALFFGALMLVIVGLWILTRDPVDDTGSAFNTQLSKLTRGGK